MSNKSAESKKKKMIKLVDKECKKRAYTLSDCVHILGVIVSVVAIIFTLWLFYLLKDIVIAYAFELPEENRLGYLIGSLLILTGLVISISGMFVSLPISRIRPKTNDQINHYYRKLNKNVGENERPILKALIKMKCVNFEFDLMSIYKKEPSMFEDKVLLTRLYE